MKKFTAIALVAGLAATGAQAQNDLVYNPEDGTLTIINPDGMNNYVLESSNDSFISANHVRFLGGLGTSQANTLSESGLAVNTNPEISLGAVLPTGLSPEEFATALTPINPDNAPKYVSGLGSPKQTFNLVYVPEPTSLALLGLGGLLVARRRRSA